jgi:hypothetical protein
VAVVVVVVVRAVTALAEACSETLQFEHAETVFIPCNLLSLTYSILYWNGVKCFGCTISL